MTGAGVAAVRHGFSQHEASPAMSRERPRPASGGDPIPRSRNSRPDLPASIRLHLGASLRDVYVSALWTPSDRVVALLAQLEAALARGADEQLAAEIRRGLQENMTLLHRFALSLTKNPARAEDLVQDTLLRAWKYRHQFVSGTNLSAWLSVIMRNTFYSNQRKRSHEVEDGDGSYAAQLVTLPSQGGGLDLQDMTTAIARLPPEMARTLTLVAIENLSYEEAATAMGCRIGTVKSRLWRARERLAEVLGYTADEIGPDRLTRSAMSRESDGQDNTIRTA